MSYNTEITIINNICIPFAYNGPCGSIQGAGQLYNYLFNHKYNDRIFYQHFKQSSYDYLEEIYKYFSLNDMRKSVIFGGNHLSVFPIHRFAAEKNYCVIILDAHRDCYDSDEDMNHGNFLKFIDNNQLYIYGYRDFMNEFMIINQNIRFFRKDEKEIFVNTILDLKSKGMRFYLDIDFDVIDPMYFSATSCPIAGGLLEDDILEIIDIIGGEALDYISFEEYIPLLDDGTSKKLAIRLIDTIVSRW